MYNNSDRVLDEVCENTRHLYRSSRVRRASIFDDEWNAITKDKVFEFYNTETGEYEYDYVRYDGKTLSWMDCSVEVDHDYGADHNLQALGDVIMEKHPELE